MRKKDIKILESVLGDLESGLEFLEGERVHICIKDNTPQGEPTSDMFSRKMDNTKLYSIHKKAGSEFQHLQNGVTALRAFLGKHQTNS